MIEKICNTITSLISHARPPITWISSALLACSLINRPGLSAMEVTSNIIRRQSEAGARIGRSPDGNESIAEKMERIRVEEIFRALKMNSVVQVVIPPGSIQFRGTGSSPTGPVIVEGFNTNNGNGMGLIR